MRIRVAVLFFLVKFFDASGQIAPGSWRMHLPYNQTIGVEESGDNILVASSAGIFSFNREDGSLFTLNKINGLNDVGISVLSKHPTRNLFLVGYENGNLDLIRDNQITNLSEILNAKILGSKKINQIHFSGSLAYISCDFGIVVYNIDKEEVKESNTGLGQLGKVIKVRDCLKFGDTLYAVTDEEGLKKLPPGVPLKNSNLWISILANSGIPSNPADLYTLDSLDQNTLVLGTVQGLHFKSGDQFTLKAGIGGRIRSVRKRNNRILVSVENNVIEYDGNADTRIRVLDPEYYKKISFPTGAILDNDGIYWISDFANGLLRIAPGDTSRILPNGPLFQEAFSLSSYKNKIVLHAGGFIYPSGGDKLRKNGGFAILSDGNWQTYNSSITPNMPNVLDMVHSFFDPADQKLYLSTFGYGIVTRKESGEFGIMNDSTTNGALCEIFAKRNCIFNPDSDDINVRNYIRITSSMKDAEGNFWATCFNNTKGSVRYYSVSEQRWKIVTLPSTNDEFPMEIISDQFDQKWVRMAPGMQSDFAAIWVLDRRGEKKLKLTNAPGFGDLPSNEIYDIKMDKSGYIWVGTTKGLAVFYNPANAFFTNGINASKPIFPPEAGRPVLENEIVTSIEIDGANRKWIGTKDNGVWLFNEDISQVIHQFNKTNSPLISNFIYDIAVNKSTGEVFFATEKGLVSFQSDATENLDEDGNPLGNSCDENKIKVFPNPVPRNHDGVISVQGLATNSEVRFLSPSGKLIYKTNSRGSMATWNGYTYDGKKVPPGVYIMLSSSPDGQSGCSSKFAILD